MKTAEVVNVDDVGICVVKFENGEIKTTWSADEKKSL